MMMHIYLSFILLMMHIYFIERKKTYQYLLSTLLTISQRDAWECHGISGAENSMCRQRLNVAKGMSEISTGMMGYQYTDLNLEFEAISTLLLTFKHPNDNSGVSHATEGALNSST